MIPSLFEISSRFGLAPVVGGLVLAGLLTGIVLFAQSIARLFNDRNP